MQVGANYLLSKRTDLYAAYGQFTRQNTLATADNKDTGFALGVRHTF
jgi:predicted porin